MNNITTGFWGVLGAVYPPSGISRVGKLRAQVEPRGPFNVRLWHEQIKITSGPHVHVAVPRLVEGVGAMGRGRQKAKQAKVARELKYFSPDTNLKALEQELGVRASDVTTDSRPRSDDNDDPDPYSDWANRN